MGNYIKGTMTARGYKLVIEKYYCGSGLRHDRKQISNRIRQLKGMYQFIKDIHSDSGLGRDENGWPTATLEWWETATKKHPEWMKLMYGPPEYLPLLERIFDGVVVDGSSSFVPGYTNADDEEPEEPEELEEPEEHEEPEQ
nr:uncharacterized protein LOC117859233 [Setaria viridis]